MKIPITLGIDIGGTFTKFGFVDKEGNILEEASLPTNAKDGVETFLNRLYDTIGKAFAGLQDHTELVGIGIGVPNGNYYKGTVENPPNLAWGKITPLADLVGKHYNLPTFLTNDANAAALGEMKFGVAKNMKDFVIITLGTGLGSGIVVNGKLVYGADGFAGELGHVNVNPNGRLCGCGKKGCLETYASATGIKRTVSKLMADMVVESELRDIPYNQLTGNMITEAALRGDLIALAAFEYTGRILGIKLADTVAHLSPEAIILFGGLTKAGAYLFDPVKKHMEENLFAIFKNKVKLLTSGLEGKNMAVLGASALIWNELT
jgi:glucokinase